MEDKIKSIIFLFSMPFIVGFSVYFLVLFHVENLPAPLDVGVVLLVSFGIPILMLWYWMQNSILKDMAICRRKT